VGPWVFGFPPAGVYRKSDKLADGGLHRLTELLLLGLKEGAAPSEMKKDANSNREASTVTYNVSAFLQQCHLRGERQPARCVAVIARKISTCMDLQMQ